MNAKISHNSTTIGHRHDSDRGRLRTADSASKFTCDNDSSGSVRHNLEIIIDRENSGKEDGNGD
jgi:hypothetical protein